MGRTALSFSCASVLSRRFVDTLPNGIAAASASASKVSKSAPHAKETAASLHTRRGFPMKCDVDSRRLRLANFCLSTLVYRCAKRGAETRANRGCELDLLRACAGERGVTFSFRSVPEAAVQRRPQMRTDVAVEGAGCLQRRPPALHLRPSMQAMFRSSPYR